MTHSHAHESTRILVQAAARVCEDKKGEDTRILELDSIDSGLADFFLITSALNERQAQTIGDEIEFVLKRDHDVYATSVEGRRQGDWILLDYVDFVVHVFMRDKRAFYDIERLRKSARPLTPAEFDEELKAALTAKTRAARAAKTPAAVQAEKGAGKICCYREVSCKEIRGTQISSQVRAQEDRRPQTPRQEISVLAHRPHSHGRSISISSFSRSTSPNKKGDPPQRIPFLLVLPIALEREVQRQANVPAHLVQVRLFVLTVDCDRPACGASQGGRVCRRNCVVRCHRAGIERRSVADPAA